MAKINIPQTNKSTRMAIQKLSSKIFDGLTINGLLYYSDGRVMSLGEATNGQLPIGSTGNAPTLAALTGTTNEIDITNAAGAITIGIVNPLIVGKGGTGAATFTDHSLLAGSGTDAFTALGAATNGQLPIGSTGADPVLAGLTGTTNQITVTNGAGTITLSTPQDIHTAAIPTFAGETISTAGTAQIDFTKTASGTFSLYNDGSAHFKGETTGTGAFIISGTGVYIRPTADGAQQLSVTASTTTLGKNGTPNVAGSLTILDGAGGSVEFSYADFNSLHSANGIVKCNGSGTFSAITDSSANWNTAYTHSQTTHDYAYISGNDAATNVTAAELEQLTDGSETALHTHASDASGSNLVSNGSFTSDTTGWSTENCTIASVAGGVSGNCLEITRTAGTNQGAIQSMSFETGATYRLSFYVKQGTSGGGGGGVFRVGVGQAGVAWSSYLQGDAGTTWSLRSFTFVAAATDDIVNVNKYNSTAGTMLFDEVKLIKVQKSLVHVYVGTLFAVPTATWTVMQLTTEVADVLGEFNTGTYRFVPDEPGYYYVAATASVESVAADKLVQIAIRLNGDDYRLLSNMTTSIAATPVPHVSGLVYMDEATYLEAVVYHNHGSDRNVNASIYASFLSIYKIMG